MLVMFAHLAIKEGKISSFFFNERERQVTTAIRYDVLPNKLFKKRIFCLCFIIYMANLNLQNILLMFHHIHVTFRSELP
jgi:hypothetical protein